MIETHALGNFVPKNIRYLLLGSFMARGMDTQPQYDWYYGSKFNQFWPIIEQVYNVKLPDKKSKIELFTQLNIGIADIIYQCERRDGNSLDMNLINIVYNPELENILRDNKIKKIFFSSRFVESKFRKVFKNLINDLAQLELVTLPSPSPRYAAITKDEKVRRYKEILPKLKIELGDIFWLDLKDKKTHPYVVINISKDKIRVVKITTNQKKASLPGNIVLNLNEGNLEKQSIIDVADVVEVNKSELGEYIGTLNKKDLKR